MWPSQPGALRARPLPRESAASYLTRLAAAYRLTAAQLLDGLHITTTGTVAALPATDIHLSAEATHRLSAFTRIPPAHLTRALARQPPPASIGTARAAVARWQPVPPAVQPLPACTACTRHQRASSDSRHSTPPPRHPPRPRAHPPPTQGPPCGNGLPELGIDDHDTLVRPPTAPVPATARTS
ncbi:TniQ family protein [Streptomyces sp. NPDC006617]|uniref:TniQ family protein n=1 Tax=Streptomyces sp. NPDC006617 TaxID=3155354 RepID=UPI00339FED32